MTTISQLLKESMFKQINESRMNSIPYLFAVQGDAINAHNAMAKKVYRLEKRLDRMANIDYKTRIPQIMQIIFCMG